MFLIDELALIYSQEIRHAMYLGTFPYVDVPRVLYEAVVGSFLILSAFRLDKQTKILPS